VAEQLITTGWRLFDAIGPDGTSLRGSSLGAVVERALALGYIGIEDIRVEPPSSSGYRDVLVAEKMRVITY